MFTRSIRSAAVSLRLFAFLALVAAVAVGLVAGPRLAGAQEDTGWASGDALVVNTDALNLRAAAAVDADVVAVLDTGAAVTITGAATVADGYDWYPVSTDAGTGYVAGQFLGTTVTVSTDLGISIGDALVVDTDGLNLRASATTDADIVATLATGDAVSVVDGPVGADGYTWFQVSSAAGTGWVAGDFLAAASTVATGSGFSTGDVLTVSSDDVNLRTFATTSAVVVATLNAGDQVTVTGDAYEADGYTWYPVDADAGSGYVAGDFLAATVTLSSVAPAAGSVVTVDTDALNLRADATTSAEVIATLETGATGTVVAGPVSADGYTWYQIETDAGTGWVAGEYLALA